MISPVSLPQVLAAREARVLRQRRLLTEHGVPVVSVTLVAPGPVKDHARYRALRDLAVEWVRGACEAAGWPVLAMEVHDAATGPEALLAVAACDAAPGDGESRTAEVHDAVPGTGGSSAVAASSAMALKRAMVALEDAPPPSPSPRIRVGTARTQCTLTRLLDLDVLPPPPPSPRIRVGTARTQYASTQSPPAAGDDAPYSGDTHPYAAGVWAEALGELAHQALLTEVHHTPKPGLVDERNTGAHTDMDLALFESSAAAIQPYLPRFVRIGAEHARLDAAAFLTAVRPLGRACETAMFAATGGVNTHKGAVFAFGLILTCAGRLLGRGEIPDPVSVCAEAAVIARGTMPELTSPPTRTTAGQRLFATAGLTGARGEAASGYATVLHQALPAFRETAAATGSQEAALGAALLELLRHAQDTNLAKDGGPAALIRVRAGAQAVLAAGGASAPGFRQRMEAFDDELIAAGLSPGGCADLLALTWCFAQWPTRDLLGGR